MSIINKIPVLLIAAFLMIACRTANVPVQYDYTIKEAKSKTFGCWINLTAKPALSEPDSLVQIPVTISGELICIDNDSVYILAQDSLVTPVYFRSILNAELYTHRNQAGKYALLSSLSILPGIAGALFYHEDAGYFLELAIPAAIGGIIFSIIEGSARRNVLKYPEKNTLDDFSILARFPTGKPINVNLNQLSLKRPDLKYGTSGQ